ncbi:hypothetical protein ABIE13_004245 [Ottowia thiooxydans]|uniref:Uncharacterized protein n=1 Tax=Ottowia thiooxydans TaxID=219182 RepID=A0ABV2QDK3_9BURK
MPERSFLAPNSSFPAEGKTNIPEAERSNGPSVCPTPLAVPRSAVPKAGKSTARCSCFVN